MTKRVDWEIPEKVWAKKGLTCVISLKGNHPMIPKQEVKISKNPMRAAVGDFPAQSPYTVVKRYYLGRYFPRRSCTLSINQLSPCG